MSYSPLLKTLFHNYLQKPEEQTNAHTFTFVYRLLQKYNIEDIQSMLELFMKTMS